jgi:hypothetical protein
VSGWTSARPGSSPEGPRSPAEGARRAEARRERRPAPPPQAPARAPAQGEEGTPHDASAYAEQARPHGLPAGAHLHDRRGLTAAGAVAMALALGIAGGLVDVLTGPGLRSVFAVCFVAGCGLAALLVHREDLVAAVVIPPLVYCVLAVLAGSVEAVLGDQSVLTRQAIELTDALILGAPVLLTATGLALVVAVVRWATGRRAPS